LTHTLITQIERAQRAARLLECGATILDVVERAGYADQPHLGRSLRRFLGHTPARIRRESCAAAIG
jgi:methylphosphotriester-DNA--protein-cysteine methyltransferase